jgi:hypothetical protein
MANIDLQVTVPLASSPSASGDKTTKVEAKVAFQNHFSLLFRVFQHHFFTRVHF